MVDARKDVTNGVVSADMSDANDNFVLIWLYLAELEAARDGETTLLAKEQAQDARLTGLETSVNEALVAGSGCPVSSNDTSAGYLNGKLVTTGTFVIAKTADVTLTTAELRPVILTENSDGGNETLSIVADPPITNTGAVAAVDLTLPPATGSGIRKPFRVTESQYLRLTADGTDKFQHRDTQSAAGGYIRSNVAGTGWVIEDLKTGIWFITDRVGDVKYDE